MTDLPAPISTVRALLKERDYMVFWASRVAGGFGFSIQGVTIGWQIYDIARRTHSVKEAALYVGLVGLCVFVPMVFLSLSAGEVADRHDRRHVTMICLVGDLMLVAMLAAATLLHFVSIPWILALAFGFGITRVFRAPAGTALGPMLVPRHLLPRAIAWNSLANQTATITAPALAGFLIAASPGLAYCTVIFFDLLALALISLISKSAKPTKQPGSRWQLIKEGLSYVWNTKLVFGAISLDLVAVLLGGVTALLPVFARDVLHVGPEHFGVLRASPAIGGVTVALLFANNPMRRRAGVTMLLGVASFGLATLVFAFSRNFWLSVAALAVVGASDMTSVYVRQTLVQLVTPDAMRGRVAAVSTLFISASNELGEFESGVAARLLGPVGAAIFGGVGSILVTGIWAKMFPALRKADRLE
jgi:MFS family permease